MAWSDVPAKLEAYAVETYAPPDAVYRLLMEFGVEASYDVPEHRREEFEDALDYRLGACINLRLSRAVRPTK